MIRLNQILSARGSYAYRALRLLCQLTSVLVVSSSVAGAQQPAPLRVGAGPHLFLDDHYIAEQQFLTRTVAQPKKQPEPVITGEGGDENFQPYMTVLRNPETGRYNAWYNTQAGNDNQSHIGTIESEDARHFIRPHKVLADPGKIRFGVSVIDRGAQFKPANERYALGYYEKDGLRIAVSPEGREWKMLQPDTVLKHSHDINAITWDPIRNQYIAILSVMESDPRWSGKRRIPFQSVSSDLIHWEDKWPIITPKIGAPIEEGETQFYAMGGVIARGDLLIGLVKVLRDDLNATPGKSAKEMGDLQRKAAGLGYTVLAWTRDGRHWQRDDQPFIPNDPHPERWDHSMAWGDSQIVVNDRTIVYYAGYKRGHKVARLTERQFGIAEMPRDRYVAREADLNTGYLLTKPLLLQARSVTVNANVVGEMSVRLVDEMRQPISGFDWTNITGDAVNHPIRWDREVATLGAKAVRMEFRLRNAQLFGFDLQ